MGDLDAIMDGRQREGKSLLNPPDLLDTVTSPGKPPGRVDKMAAAVLQLCYALRLIGKACDEGPLRTAILLTAARAEARARDAVFNPSLRRARGRRQSNDERAVASEARDGAEDDQSSLERLVEGPDDGT